MSTGESNAQAFGDTVRRIRLERGLSLQELAGKEFDQVFISHIEAGRNRPDFSSLQTLSRRLGVELTELTRWDEELQSELLWQAKAAIAAGNANAADEYLSGVLIPENEENCALFQRLRAETALLKDDIPVALAMAEEALSHAEKTSNLELISQSCDIAAKANYRSRNFTRSLLQFERSASIATEHRLSNELILRGHINSGVGNLVLGNVREATRRFGLARELAEKMESLEDIIMTDYNLAEAMRQSGDWSSAIAYAEKAKAMSERFQFAKFRAYSVHNLGHALADSGDLESARPSQMEALVAADELADLPLRALALEQLVRLDVQEHKWADAISRAPETLSAVREVGDTCLEALVLAAVGEAYEQSGYVETADKYFENAHHLLDTVTTWAQVSPGMAKRQVLLRHGDVLRHRGDHEQSAEMYRAAAAVTL